MFIPMWLLIILVIVILSEIGSSNERADSAESELGERQENSHYESDYDN